MIMYDYVFITHVPAFYKVNLYNRIAKHCRIFVIFIAKTSVLRTKDFIGTNMMFDYKILYPGPFEKRSIIKNIHLLHKYIRNLQYKTIVVNGWDLLEFWYATFLLKAKQKAVVVESNISESTVSGLKWLLKYFFLKNIDIGFPSGQLHQKLLDTLAFNGKSFFTKGVGIFNRIPFEYPDRKFQNMFLFVGRLSEEKNITMLIDVFNKHPELSLTIVGSGPQNHYLKSIAAGNIHFYSHIDNTILFRIYLEHDVFILPSLKEPWGLVVDEALYYGLPVIVSSHAGCHSELVVDGKHGIVFDPTNQQQLEKAILKMTNETNYYAYQKSVRQIDFYQRDEIQILAYRLGISR